MLRISEVVDKPGVLHAVSSALLALEHQRKLEYRRSNIELVDTVRNTYPLADIIMKSCTGMKVDGNLEGKGSAVFNNGHTYQGNFHHGVMHGEGKYIWKDGVFYEGGFTNCKISGNGKYSWPDGSVYSGQVLEGLRHGQGTYHCSTTGKRYTGNWVCGKREGRGKLEYDDTGQSYYDGEWTDNRQEGYGVRQYRSGNVYKGMWSKNVRHGKGTMHWYDREETYSGNWTHGVQDSNGEHVWVVRGTDNAQFPLCNRYVGEWRTGAREGTGIFHYASGAVYSGEWVDNKKHGKGRFVFQSGQVYEGRFSNDIMTGYMLETASGPLRPQTPLGSLIGDIDTSDALAGNSVTEKFNLEISRVLPSSSNTQHELKQVYCVLLRNITQLKRVYHLYSSLGLPDNPKSHNMKILTRLQLWQFLRDCHLHQLGLTLYDVDIAIDPSSPSHHDPNTTFLMREFLQALVFLAQFIYGEAIPKQVDNPTSGTLAQCLNKFILTIVLPLTSTLGDLLYGQSLQHTCIALGYKQDVWNVFQKLLDKSTGENKFVRVRDVFLLLQDCGLITSDLTATKVASLLVNSNPLALNEGYYNMEVKVVFLEFLEALLKCAVEWSKISGHGSSQDKASSQQMDTARTVNNSPNTSLYMWKQTLNAFFSHFLPKALAS